MVDPAKGPPACEEDRRFVPEPRFADAWCRNCCNGADSMMDHTLGSSSGEIERGAKTAIVIGGGVTGYATALELTRLSFQVTLDEAKPLLGGILRDLETYHACASLADRVRCYPPLLERPYLDG